MSRAIRRLKLLILHPLYVKRKLFFRQDLEVLKAWGFFQNRSSNPLTDLPRKHFSQSDEDGIIAQIIDRLVIPPAEVSFVEFGVGNGTENNSISLLAKGGRGVWVGGEKLSIDVSGSDNLKYLRTWVTLDSIGKALNESEEFLGTKQITMLSMDLDGNDIYFLERILDLGFKPKFIVAEYNGRFPVGSIWKIPYDASHSWNNDDYFGASISCIVETLQKYEYFPVACSINGANVFLVNEKYREFFSDIPVTLEAIFQPTLYYAPKLLGHRTSRLTLDSLLNKKNGE